jgi:hypothetical protein
MTMQNASHPDDERLAAYAGGDRDAVADPSLSAHISSCDRCGPMVDELAGLRSALAGLPDLAPSRPLRLIPPVPAASAPRPTPLGWLRRLAGPAMAAGAGLVLIGAIGVGATSGIGSLFSQAASGVFQNVGDNLQGGGAPEGEATPSDNSVVPGAYGASTPPGSTKGVTDSGRDSEPPSPRSAQASPTPVPVDIGSPDDLKGKPSPGQPWLTVLIAGVALFGTSAVLRFSISPRAG